MNRSAMPKRLSFFRKVRPAPGFACIIMMLAAGTFAGLQIKAHSPPADTRDARETLDARDTFDTRDTLDTLETVLSGSETEMLHSPGAVQVVFFENGRPVDPPGVLDDTIRITDVDSLLARYYAAGGYLNAGIDRIIPPSPDRQELRIYTSPGCWFSIANLDVEMVDNDPDLLDGFTAYYGSGDPYDATALEAELRRFVNHFEMLGYPLARAEISEFEVHTVSCEVSVEVLLRTGEPFYSAGVITEGLEQNQPGYIETASGIRADERITPALIRKGRRNLRNTGLFHDVSEGDIRIRDGEAYIYFDVEERRANNVDLMFGYAPGQVEGYNIIGRGDLLIRNVGWPGSELNLSFERLENMVTRMESSFGRQWIRGIPAGGGMGFRFLQQDTSYQVREWHVDGYYDWTPERRFSVRLRQENASANTNPELPMRVLDGFTRSAGVGFSYDNADNRTNPTAGMTFQLYMESGFRRVTDSRAEELESQGTMMQQRVQAMLQTYYSPLPRHVAAFRILGTAVESPEYNETDLIRLGGAQSIRGYREEQFRVSRSAWGDVEYRYLLDPYSHAFVFGAGGIYERPAMVGEDTGGLSDWLYSGGFGFRYRTPIGLLQFTYAVSADDPLHNGKVHFHLSADF